MNLGSFSFIFLEKLSATTQDVLIIIFYNYKDEKVNVRIHQGVERGSERRMTLHQKKQKNYFVEIIVKTTNDELPMY
jgi:hypothetical protein